jgi:hypothetical protein
VCITVQETAYVRTPADGCDILENGLKSAALAHITNFKSRGQSSVI